MLPKYDLPVSMTTMPFYSRLFHENTEKGAGVVSTIGPGRCCVLDGCALFQPQHHFASRRCFHVEGLF